VITSGGGQRGRSAGSGMEFYLPYDHSGVTATAATKFDAGMPVHRH
jgi:hypothetical protein